MPTPNLFSFAPSELSQDAVLSWLLSWADPTHAATAPVLHQTARRLLAAIVAKADQAPPADNASVVVHKQHARIDILVEIGESHVLAIEDKTHTGDHSDQLQRYAAILERDFPTREYVRIYLKTGDQCSYGEIEAQGWRVFHRADLLATLRPARAATDNAILRDFIDHLESIERTVQAYATLPPASWDHAAWRGFFGILMSHFEGGWDYVANATGGFMGFWWNWLSVDRGMLYLQLEGGKLVVKLSVENEDDQGPVRDRWVHRAIEHLSGHGFERPGRLGRGRTMTVAVYREDYRVMRDGCLDLDATVACLRDAEVRLERLAATEAG